MGTPAGAHVSGWGHNWKKHVRPKADQRYLPGGTLPSGATIRGVYRISGTGTDSGSTDISFGYALASTPTRHFISQGAPAPAQCPGSVSNPQAARGHLCVYELTDTNAASQAVTSPLSRFGFGLTASSAGAAPWITHGTWAVRSP
jgi:hypothetical protein